MEWDLEAFVEPVIVFRKSSFFPAFEMMLTIQADIRVALLVW
jgi:hypothetical protein